MKTAPGPTTLGLALAAVMFTLAGSVWAADGDLDRTFGIDGRVTTDFGGTDQANALVVQLDGRIVAAGVGGPSFDRHFALARYTTDGSLDAS